MSLLPKLPVIENVNCENCASRQHSWFQPCKNKDLRNVQLLRSSQNTLSAGKYLFMEGERPSSAFTLQEGWALCYKTLSNGRRQIVSVAFSGDFLGYRTDMSKPIDYSVIAVTDCRICSFSQGNIRQLLSKSPALLYSLINIQDRQTIDYRTSLTYVGQAPAKFKLAYFLINILQKLEKRGVDIKRNIKFPLTHEDVADCIGITAVHMCRIAVDLRRNNIVDCRYNNIKVNDYEALNNLAKSIFQK